MTLRFVRKEDDGIPKGDDGVSGEAEKMKRIIGIIAVLFVFAGCVHFQTGVAGDARIGTAVDQGTSYLKRAVNEARHHLACRASDGSVCPVHATGHVFAGFFIAEAIGVELSPAESQKIMARMNREKRQGVWGYMPYAPVDSDDTAFVIRTYRILGRDVAADSLLRFYDKEAKAFTTFDGRGTAALVFEPSVDANYGLHPEVNANIYTLLADTPLSGLINEDLIIRSQDPQGWWRSYFYPGRYYATAMNLTLLCKTKKGEDARAKGILFLQSNQNPDGSWGRGAYETSLALTALAACGVCDHAFRKGITWLIGQQNPDGSWREEGAPLWEYVFGDLPPVIWRAYDTGGVVTTALAVSALKSSCGGQ